MDTAHRDASSAAAWRAESVCISFWSELKGGVARMGLERQERLEFELTELLLCKLGAVCNRHHRRGCAAPDAAAVAGGVQFYDDQEGDSQVSIPRQLARSFGDGGCNLANRGGGLTGCCIARHLFQRSMVKSFQHLAVDLIIAGAMAFGASYIDTSGLPFWGRALLWMTYWFWQGAVCTGIWVIAHECGHQAFSPSKFVNDSVGWVLHSALLVPYHSWRISHRNHHSNTGSCENDEVFCPARRDDYHEEDGDLMRDVPLVVLWRLFTMLTVGWMPGYLFLNATGPHKYAGKTRDHFNPSSALFAKEEYFDIVSSDVGMLLMVGVLAFCCSEFGVVEVLKYYWMPYMWVNNWLVMITYLQHTDVFMPHYRAEEWNWLRGALCTVDRSFTPVLDHLFHHITDSHVCHHLFHTMPFYNAVEATKYIKEVLGPYYMKDDTFFLKALYRSMYTCRFVENEGNIVWYRQHD
eukprot:scaffold3581_cov252-Pinguiococcus_pyrenoidosus.AAC.2